MSHFTFIAAAYGVSVLALAVLALALLFDYRAQKEALKVLKARDRKSKRAGRAPAGAERAPEAQP